MRKRGNFDNDQPGAFILQQQHDVMDNTPLGGTMSIDSTNQHLLEVLFIDAPVPVLGSSSHVELSTCQVHLGREERNSLGDEPVFPHSPHLLLLPT